jgi:RNA polymerase sigma-70 factor (ECF subfamily)
MGSSHFASGLPAFAFAESLPRVTFAPSLPRAMVTSGRSCFEAFQGELDYLFRTLRRLGVHSADLEDEAHEVFLVLDRKWSEYDPSRPLRPYLFGIAYRVVAASRRRRKREEPRTLDELPDTGPMPDDAIEVTQARKLVLRALEGIALERRAVFVMHDIDEISMREITRSLSIPLFTGYSRLRKARKEFEAAIRTLRHGRAGR